jgi:hypothetical protein
MEEIEEEREAADNLNPKKIAARKKAGDRLRKQNRKDKHAARKLRRQEKKKADEGAREGARAGCQTGCSRRNLVVVVVDNVVRCEFDYVRVNE